MDAAETQDVVRWLVEPQKRSCQLPGPMLKRQMVDLAVPTINIHALARLIGQCPEAACAGGVGRRYRFLRIDLDFRKNMGPPKSCRVFCVGCIVIIGIAIVHDDA